MLTGTYRRHCPDSSRLAKIVASNLSWQLKHLEHDRIGEHDVVARTSAAGVELLNRYRDGCLDELWLDHDLGGDDTIWPVVEILEQAAFEKRPFDIGVIKVHSANPGGAAKIAQVLRHWGYRVHVAAGSTDVGHLDGPATS
ncbi:cyclic-phosphate processing receiver domain-containing protein [Micromonospora sp. MS34]|uniref:cyclic-phosphate processing receiver domain-containing protein n=1 Tax=Micromonospora sp. MS34 TaxID=3385971 RepID=UPI0039A30A22